MKVVMTNCWKWTTAFLAERRNANSRNISNIKIPWTGQLLNRHYNLVMYNVNRNKQDTADVITTAWVCLCASTLLWSHLHGPPVYSSCNSLRPDSWGAMMGCRSLLSSQCVTPPYRHRQLRNTEDMGIVCVWPQLSDWDGINTSHQPLWIPVYMVPVYMIYI